MTFSAKIVDRFRSLFNLELKYFVRLRPFMRGVEVPALGLWKLLEVKQKGLMLNQSRDGEPYIEPTLHNTTIDVV